MQTAKKLIYIGCDHAGFELKEVLKKYLLAKSYKLEDVGCYSLDRVDYPDYAAKVCSGVQKDDFKSIGIVVCGSGIGISIATNKFKGIRCACCNDYYAALMSRKKDDCNVLALGARIIGEEKAKIITDAFLETEFEEDNYEHQKRLEKIKEIEEKYLRY